jgi:hypothetical protein
MSRSFAERNRFGRIPTPTPLGVGDINAYVLFPSDGPPGGVREGGPGLTLIDEGSVVLETRDGRERARAAA